MSTDLTYEDLKKRVKELEKAASFVGQTQKELQLMQQCVDNASDAVFWVDDQANFILGRLKRSVFFAQLLAPV